MAVPTSSMSGQPYLLKSYTDNHSDCTAEDLKFRI